ncbi:MAG: FtsX-like permease family protein, partial [Bacteroidota bacterium]
GADPEAAAARANEAHDRLVEDGRQRAGTTLYLTPVTDIRLRSVAEAQTEFEPQGDIRYVWLFSAIALVILLLAAFNYTNLATARGAQRTTEVGVRKALGADRHQLTRLFLSESFVVTLVAAVLALGLVAVTLPALSTWMGRPFALPLAAPWFWAAFASVVVLLAVGAGSYPAFVLSAVRPTSALKAEARVASRTTLRKILLVGQFAATIALVASSIGIQRQLHYVQNTRLGFEADGVLALRTRGAIDDSRTAFENEAERIPGVEAVAFGSGIPGEPTAIKFFDSSEVEGQQGREETIVFDALGVGPDFASTLDFEVVEGRVFSPDRPDDASGAVVINETAARDLGWAEPLGKTIGTGEAQLRVIGVVRDVHLNDMRQAVGPLLLEYDPGATGYAVVRLRADGLPATLAALEGAWEDVAPDQLFDAFFLDDHFAAFYRAERMVGQVFLAFTGLAIVVACLGLFGLAMLMAQQRTREIGIRKVLGASVASLVALLSREFAGLIVVAFVVAVPAAYVFLQDWLADFVYRAEPTAGLFLWAGVLTLGIALVTVSAHTLRAATADPVHALRSE